MNSTVSRFFGFAFLLFPLAIAHLQAISRPDGYTAKDETGSETVGPTNGWLIIQGGGAVTNEVKERFVALAGGPQANFVVIPTALSDNEIDVDNLRQSFQNEYDIRHIAVLHTRDRAQANSAGFVESLRHASGVWVTGGRQWRLVDAYLGTAVEREIKALVARGGVVGGGSAGATIQVSFLVRGAPGNAGNPNGDNTIMMSPGHETGFGLLPNSAIDQHVNTRGRRADLGAVISAHPELLGIGIDESAAIVVHRDSFFVVGGQVVIHDGKQHRGASYYLLSSGQAFNLTTRSTMDQRTEDYPLTLTVTAATRSQAKSAVKTVGQGVLESKDGAHPPMQFKMECEVNLYSLGQNLYPARWDGSHKFKILARPIDSDRLSEHACRY